MTVSEILRWTVGAVVVTRIEETIVPMTWEQLIPSGAAQVDGCRPWIDPYVSSDGAGLLLSVHSFIVETPESTIVVDTCVGPGTNKMFLGDTTFPDRLAEHLDGGLDAVDVVVCTHLHFDHVGWNTTVVDGVVVPTFANARYLVSEVELSAERDRGDTEAFKESIAPIDKAGKLHVVASDHRIDAWTRLVSTPGHTPGHVALAIGAERDDALITGDLLHSPLQFAHPDSPSSSDHDPGTAVATRHEILDKYVDSDTLILGTHFAPPTAGHLRRHPSGVRFEAP